MNFFKNYQNYVKKRWTPSQIHNQRRTKEIGQWLLLSIFQTEQIYTISQIIFFSHLWEKYSFVVIKTDSSQLKREHIELIFKKPEFWITLKQHTGLKLKQQRKVQAVIICEYCCKIIPS